MSWFGTTDVGDHVRARRDITEGWADSFSGRPSIRRGRPGIVRDVQRGLFSTRYTVEFDDGFGTRTISNLTDGDLRSTGGHGQGAWDTKQSLRRGVRLGLFCAFTLPALIALGWYFLNGGTLAELLPALIDEALSLALGLAAWGFGLLGPAAPLLVLGLLGFLLLRGRRSSST
jgi:hypothetical protein